GGPHPAHGGALGFGHRGDRFPADRLDGLRHPEAEFVRGRVDRGPGHDGAAALLHARLTRAVARRRTRLGRLWPAGLGQPLVGGQPLVRIGVDVPSVLPALSSARTATNGCVVWTAIVVSKPVRG